MIKPRKRGFSFLIASFRKNNDYMLTTAIGANIYLLHPTTSIG